MMRLGSWKARGRRTLAAAALTTTLMTATAGWVVDSEQQTLTGPPPGAQAWRSDDSIGMRLPDPAATRPEQVAGFFASLSAVQRDALAARHPLTVGNLDGAPVDLRIAANSRALKAERSREQARAADPDLTAQDRSWARARVTRYTELLAPGRQILVFDPRDRGQVAEVYGDLTRARHVSVVVPGSDIDLDTFDRERDPYGTPTGMARSLHTAAGPGTAVIAWAGYTTPVGIGPDAASGRLAQGGAPRLVRFAQGLVEAGSPEPAVFCHSYGSVVCGLAADELPASDLVVLASPGMRAESVDDLRTSARVWAARSEDDWIRRIPHVELFGLGHGADPTDPAFGARRVPADLAQGHTGYFTPGTDSLRAFADIATGDPS